MPSKYKQLHIPLTDKQHEALEQYAQGFGVSKAEAVRMLLTRHVPDFGSEPVARRGTYERKRDKDDE